MFLPVGLEGDEGVELVDDSVSDREIILELGRICPIGRVLHGSQECV